MNWSDREPDKTPDGEPMCKGVVELTNDKREFLGSVMWFYDEGPFYAHAVDLNEPGVTRRIGPHMTLDGGKRSVENVVEGHLDVSSRAGYQRQH